MDRLGPELRRTIAETVRRAGERRTHHKPAYSRALTIQQMLQAVEDELDDAVERRSFEHILLEAIQHGYRMT